MNLRGLVLGDFYFGMCGSFDINSLWVVFAWECCGWPERTTFFKFFRRVLWSCNDRFWTISIFWGCGGLKRGDFGHFYFGRMCRSWKDWFSGIPLWEDVVILKGLIFNNIQLGRMWWSWKDWIWTMSTLGGGGGLERTDFQQFPLLEDVMV